MLKAESSMLRSIFLHISFGVPRMYRRYQMTSSQSLYKGLKSNLALKSKKVLLQPIMAQTYRPHIP